MPDILPPDLASLAALYGETIYVIPEANAEQPEANAEQPELGLEPKPEPQPEANAEQPEAKAEQPELGLGPQPEPNPQTAKGITWRPKATSKVLFVLRLPEFKNPALTELLKKIVEALGIPTEQVGFGQIEGQVQLEEFDQMPNPHAVVFDNEIWGGKENPVLLGKGEVFFSIPLEQLQHSVEDKRLLWNHLKALKERLQ